MQGEASMSAGTVETVGSAGAEDIETAISSKLVTTHLSGSFTDKSTAQPVLLHSMSHGEEDEEVEHEILNAYEDEGAVQTSACAVDIPQDEERDEDQPFVPLPPPGGIRLATGGGVAGQPAVPAASAPQLPTIPASPAPHIAFHPAQSPAPHAAQPVPQVQPAPSVVPHVQPAPAAIPHMPPAAPQPASLHHSISLPRRHHHHPSPNQNQHHTQPLHHHRPAIIHPHHHKAKHSRRAQRSHRHHHYQIHPAIAVITAACIALGVIGILIFGPHSHKPGEPGARLIGPATPGSTIILQGNNFTPGERVTITIDAPLSASTGDDTLADQASSMSMNISAPLFKKQTSTSSTQSMTSTVNSNGTFDAPIPVESQWPRGSTHTVYIYSHNRKPITLPFSVMVPTVQTGLIGCVNEGAPLMLGSITEGSGQHILKAVTLCTTGAGQVNWLATWDQSWLKMNSSGQIMAPQSGTVALSAATGGLKPGLYSTTITFSSHQSSTRVLLRAMLMVLKKGVLPVAPTAPAAPAQPASPGAVSPPLKAPQIACVSVTPPSLYFTAIADENSQLPASVTVSNCGDAGAWSGSVSTSSGGQWLAIGSSRGTLASAGQRDIDIAASSADLAPGIYSGHILFRLGSASAGVTVVFHVNAPKSLVTCISANPQLLVFRGIAGQSDSLSQRIMLTSCGAAGHWSSSIATDDGADWLDLNMRGHALREGRRQPVFVSVSGQQLARGAYTGSITFLMGSSIAKVNILFIVEGACVHAVSPPLLFKGIQGQDDTESNSASFLNCGVTGPWYAAPVTTDGGNWLQIDRTYGSRLAAGATQSINVTVSDDGLKRGIYTGRIVFVMGSSVAFAPVTFIIIEPQGSSRPCLNVSTSEMDFTAIQGQGDPEAQSVTLGNCGNDGTWTASQPAQQSWVHIDPQSGTLAGAAAAQVGVTLSTSDLAVGKHVGSITFTLTSNSDRSKSASQTVLIDLTIQPPPRPSVCIQINPPSLTFNVSAQATSGGSLQMGELNIHTITLTNCGPNGGTWSIPTPIDTDSVHWLMADPTNGALTTGSSADISFEVTKTDLDVGTDTAEVPITFTSSSGATHTTTVPVTLNVSSPSSTTCHITPAALTINSTWGSTLPGLSATIKGCSPGASWSESDDSNTDLTVPAQGVLDSNGNGSFTVRPQSNPSSPGHYNYTVTIGVDPDGSLTLPVTWNVLAPSNPTCIRADSSSLALSVPSGASTQQSIAFTNCGAYAGPIVVQTQASHASWLTISSGDPIDGSAPYDSGSGPAISIYADSTNLPANTYQGGIVATIKTSQGSQSVTVPVTFQIQAPASSAPSASPSPGSTVTPTVTPTNSPTPGSTITPTPASSITPTVTGTDTPTPTVDPTPTPTVEPSPTDTPTPTPTVDPTPTVEPSPTDTPTPAPTLEPSPTDTPTPTPTDTPTPTVSPSGTPTPGS